MEVNQAKNLEDSSIANFDHNFELILDANINKAN